MKTIKLPNVQVQELQRIFDSSIIYDGCEEYILSQFNAANLYELNAADYDGIMEEIQEFFSEKNAKYTL